jgi:beta-N-acetylhexosaminidase
MTGRRVVPALLFGVAIAIFAQQSRTPAPPAKAPAAKPADEAAALLAAMPLRDRVAQLVMGVANGDVYSTQSPEYRRYRRWVQELHIGGLIINNDVEFGSARNANPHALAVFLNQMQRLARVPLLIGSDFERAASMRVTGGTQFPHNMAFGAAGNFEDSKFAGWVTAREARALGVHWVFAPVADVNNNPRNPVINIRAYGEDPERVAGHVAAFIEGAHSDPAARVLVTAKHFPGHGDTDVDSHYGLPRLLVGRERMDAVELRPFRAAIAKGVDSVMTAHMAVPELDATGLPATVSAKVLTGLLRKELGFRNLVVTDAMNMQGLAGVLGQGEAAIRAIEAGADVLLMPPDPEQAISAVTAAVAEGRLSRQRIQESALRVLRAKVRLGLTRRKLVDLNAIADVLAAPEAAERAQQIANRAVTLLRHDGHVLPLSPARQPCLLVINSLRTSLQGQRLAREFRRRAPKAQVVSVDTGMPYPALEAAMGAAQGCTTVVAASFAAITANTAEVNRLLTHLSSGPVPLVIASFNDPYMGAQFPRAAAYLTPFSSAHTAEIAAARALFGEIAISGRSPVSIPELAPLGAGLSLPSRAQMAGVLRGPQP